MAGFREAVRLRRDVSFAVVSGKGVKWLRRPQEAKAEVGEAGA